MTPDNNSQSYKVTNRISGKSAIVTKSQALELSLYNSLVKEPIVIVEAINP